MPEPDVFELLATLSPQEGVLALQEAGARDHVPARAAKLEVLASARDWATTDERKAALRRALMRRLGRDIRPEAGVPGFHVVRRLGMGAFGHVFLAIEEESGHQVALKVFHGYAFEEHERAEALDRFRRGTRMLRDFDGQPGFVRVLRDGAEDDPPWLAMEYYPLGNLGEYLNRRRRQGDPVPVATICELVTSVCTAVGHAHACGVIHRDIKPTNILLQESGDGRLHACLGDFDLAFPRGETALTGMTGTLAYMPPETQLEVLHGAPPLMLPLSPKLADRSVMQDVYAVAGVLFFALTGAVPQFTEGRAAEIADCFRSEGERRREVGESGLLTRLEPLLQQALHRDPGRRPQTASELGEMIRWAMHVGDTPPPAVDRLRAAPEAPSFSEVTEDRFGRVAAVRAAAAQLTFRWIPPGTFTMGSPEGEPGRWDAEGPQHRVTIGRGFWLGATPVTQGQYQAVMGKNSSRFPGAGPEAPVEQVSWEEAQAFLAKLNDLAGSDAFSPRRAPRRPTMAGRKHTRLEGERTQAPKRPRAVVFHRRRSGSGNALKGTLQAPIFRLPTEAEWEYACRAGAESALYTGPITIKGQNNAPDLDPIAWYGGNSGVEYEGACDSSGWPEKQHPHKRAGTHPVGLKAPNAWGLHDMLGNVCEWCEDEWHGDYEGAPTDGSAWVGESGEGRHRVFRGGGWGSFAGDGRCACRCWWGPGRRLGSLGFRLVLAPGSTGTS